MLEAQGEAYRPEVWRIAPLMGGLGELTLNGLKALEALQARGGAYRPLRPKELGL